MARRSFKVLAFLPDFRSYIDRAMVFRSLSDHTDSVTLVARNVREFSEDETNCSNFRTLELGGLLERNRIAAQFIATCRDEAARCIIHEPFYGLAFPAAYFSERGGKFHRRVLSLYFPNASYLFQRQWMRTDKESTSPRELLHYVALFSKRILWELPSCHLADMVICNSDEVCEGVQQFYRVSSSKTVTLPTAVDTHHFYPRQVKRSDFGFSEAELLLLNVGSLQARKGIYVLLRTARILKRRGLSFKVVCAGHLDPYDRQDFLSMMSSLGLNDYFILLNSVRRVDLPLWYTLADMLIFPSFSEGSPRVVKEAASCGCPIVATDLAGIRMLDIKGEYIRFVPVNKPDCLAAAIEEILQNRELRNRMAEIGRRVMERDFTPQRIAERLVACYDTLWT